MDTNKDELHKMLFQQADDKKQIKHLQKRHGTSKENAKSVDRNQRIILHDNSHLPKRFH